MVHVKFSGNIVLFSFLEHLRDFSAMNCVYIFRWLCSQHNNYNSYHSLYLNSAKISTDTIEPNLECFIGYFKFQRNLSFHRLSQITWQNLVSVTLALVTRDSDWQLTREDFPPQNIYAGWISYKVSIKKK